MAIDNETREPTGFAIYEERAVVRPGAKPDGSEDRTVIVREYATLDHFHPMPGHPGADHTTHGATEYFGQFLAQGGRDPSTGAPLPVRVLRFPIPARTLALAFRWLEDGPAVAGACAAAVKAEGERMRAAVFSRSGSGLLIAGKQP